MAKFLAYTSWILGKGTLKRARNSDVLDGRGLFYSHCCTIGVEQATAYVAIPYYFIATSGLLVETPLCLLGQEVGLGYIPSKGVGAPSEGRNRLVVSAAEEGERERCGIYAGRTSYIMEES